MNNSTVIPARFNGPPQSGNGGYSCGIVAALIDGPARVRLHVPPPLDTTFRVERSNEELSLYDGETLIATGSPTTLTLEVPTPPSIEKAQEAMTRYVCYDNHAFPTCFVCGPSRSAHDGLELFPGPVEDWQLLACVWRPEAMCADAEGNIPYEIVWSALDCPGFFAVVGETPRPALLGQLEGQVMRSIRANDPLVVYSWPIGEDGRKLYAGTAIATAEGEVVACAKTTWIELKS